MKQISIPGTDLSVSQICLGTMTFGTPVAEREAIALVHGAIDLRINFFDTANIYEGYNRTPGSAGGVGEEILGKALKGKRDGAVVATKVGMKVGENPEDELTSPKAIKKQLEISLARLKTDVIDIYYLHRFDPVTPAAEIIYALDEEIRAGKIKHYGVSNYRASELKTLVGAAEENDLPLPVLCQPPLSLLKQDALEDIVPYCLEKGIGVVPYQCLQGGLLTGKYKRNAPVPSGSRAAEKESWLWPLNDDLYERLEGIEAEANKAGLDMTGYAINWVLQTKGVVSAIIGAKNIDQITAAVKGSTIY